MSPEALHIQAHDHPHVERYPVKGGVCRGIGGDGHCEGHAATVNRKAWWGDRVRIWLCGDCAGWLDRIRGTAPSDGTGE